MQGDVERRAGRFAIGSRVTVCADEACTRVLRFGTVKRIGNEGLSWRLAGTGEWYDATTGRRVGFDNPHYARPYHEGDEALMLAESARRAEIEQARARVHRARMSLGFAVNDRTSCERRIAAMEFDLCEMTRRLTIHRTHLADEKAQLVALLAKEQACRSLLERSQVEESLSHENA